MEGLGKGPWQFNGGGVHHVVPLLGDEVRQVRAKDVAGEEEGGALILQRPRRELPKLGNGLVCKEGLKGGLSWLICHAGNQVPLTAVCPGGVDGAGDPEIGEVVGRQPVLVARIVKDVQGAGEVNALKAVVLRTAVLAHVPLAHVAEPVPLLL